MHKTPVGECFIIASPKCSLKPLLKDITSILKLFQKQIESFHDKNRVWVGVSNFWIIQNNKPDVDRIRKISAKKRAVPVRTFDFSTLYTKIPHNLLKEALFEILDFVFKGGISNGVYVTKMVQFGGNLLGISRYTLNCQLKLFWNLSLIMRIFRCEITFLNK